VSELARTGKGALRILEEGVTCWRIAPAHRAAVLIDAATYYRVLLEALRQARGSIMILGWDFDPAVRLDPTDPHTELRRLLPSVVERCPDLHVHLLIWDISMVFGPSSTANQLLDRAWHAHPRIHFRFDGQHPFVAAHHEKVVCIDDALAFAGGIDLTVKRWDTSEHDPADPRRVDESGERYDPVHDLQMAVSGKAARALAELARARWAETTGENLPAYRGTGDPWPAALTPWLTDVPVGIARTRPPVDDRPAVQEVAALNAAALAGARRSVYIEAQYLAAQPVADQLIELLDRADGPEIVILVWRQAIGWLERFAMGSNRDRLLRRLAAADRHERLRAYWVAVPGELEVEVNLHAKLIIVDDAFVRIGSSNLNNRSLGLDTECDLAIEASDPSTRAAIARLRNTLLAEHLVRSPEEVGRAIAEGGLIAAIERLNPGRGRLRPYPIDPDDGPKEPFPGTALLDPAEPLDLDYLARTLRSGLFAR
jgi:phosphatidylserine/phosphatidylglycerophosphate/cardiolipin synthase-like enzyme